MTNGEIVEEIFKTGKYKALCVTIAKKSHLAEELYSEFLKALLEIKDSGLQDAHKGGYLDFFCVRVIKNIWGTKDRVKAYSMGTTSPLFEFTSTYEGREEEMFSEPVPSEPYNIKIDYISNEVKRIIKKEFDNADKDKMYAARVFHYSYIENKNPVEFSKKSGIPYWAVIKTCDKMKKYLKKKLGKKWSTILQY